MNLLSPLWLQIISEWLVNLSAGWFGAVVAVPVILPLRSLRDFLVLTINLVLAMIGLYLAKKLRELREQL